MICRVSDTCYLSDFEKRAEVNKGDKLEPFQCFFNDICSDSSVIFLVKKNPFHLWLFYLFYFFIFFIFHLWPPSASVVPAIAPPVTPA